MTQEEIKIVPDWRPRIIAVGALIGALVGAGAAYLLIQNSKDEMTPPQVNASDGVKLGITVLGLLRQVATLRGEE
jgi:hypothetical protein